MTQLLPDSISRLSEHEYYLYSVGQLPSLEDPDGVQNLTFSLH
jgi:hypothetical protein